MGRDVNQSFSTSIHFGLHSKTKEQQWKLRIHCEACIRFKLPPFERYKNNLKCSECILQILSSIIEDKHISQIELGTSVFSPSEDLGLLYKLKWFYSQWLKIKQESTIRKNNCPLHQTLFIEQFLFELVQEVSNNNVNLCSPCKKIWGKLRSSTIWSLFSKIPSFDIISHLLYIGPYGEKLRSSSSEADQDSSALASYKIPTLPLLTVDIYPTNQTEKIFNITTKFGEKSQKFYSTLLSTVTEKIHPLYFDHLLSMGDIIEKYNRHYSNFLRLNYHNLDDEEVRNLAFFLSMQKLHLNKLFPLLIDDLIDEIYLDAPNEQIYLDHREWGRCITHITLTERDIDTIKTYLRISSNKRLDPTNPTIKHSIHNQFFQCRFAVDVAPGVISGFAMNIRKMNRKVFTLPELVYKEFCSSQLAAFLLLCLTNRINITAVGETNTGKTTLINSLDLLTPSHLRKIYIEESPESLEVADSHQLKYVVDSVYTNSSKIEEIYRLLHRNPDLVYLGEILTEQEAQAMFHCLSAGLRGFQTIHARDIKSLVNRWQFHFNINPSCFNDLDIVILLKRSRFKRYVAKVVEIQYKSKQTKIIPIFTFDPESSMWIQNSKWEDLQCFQRLLLSKLEKTTLNQQLALFNQVFSILSRKHHWNPRQQCQFFQSLYLETRDSSIKSNKWAQLQESVQELHNIIKG